jgi:hypothetical protein
MHPPYIAFLLRLWQTGEGGQGNWLASLEDPHTHQVTGFEALEGLYDYLKSLEAAPGDRTNPIVQTNHSHHQNEGT